MTTYLDGKDGPHSLEAEIARRKRQDAAILRQDWEETEREAGDSDEDAASRLTISDEDLDALVNGAQRTVSVTCYKRRISSKIAICGWVLKGDDHGRMVASGVL